MKPFLATILTLPLSKKRVMHHLYATTVEYIVKKLIVRLTVIVSMQEIRVKSNSICDVRASPPTPPAIFFPYFLCGNLVAKCPYSW